MPQRTFPFAAVLFDLDGVVIDSTELHYRVWSAFGASRGYVPTREELVQTNGCRCEDVVRRWLGQHLSDAVVAELTAARETMGSEYLRTGAVQPITGVESFIRTLQQGEVPMALATSAIPLNTHLSLERLGLHTVFKHRVTAADVQKGKPDPEPYLKAAALLNIPAARCLVIEDSLAGITSGKAAGAKVLALTTTFSRETLSPLNPDWIAQDFNALPVELRG
jgi:HAD superfamily hydrolase (TIGR01509 family)